MTIASYKPSAKGFFPGGSQLKSGPASSAGASSSSLGAGGGGGGGGALSVAAAASSGWAAVPAMVAVYVFIEWECV